MRKYFPLFLGLAGCIGAQHESLESIASPVVTIEPVEKLPKQSPSQSPQTENFAKYDSLKDESLPVLIDKLKRKMKDKNIRTFFSYPYGKYECGFSVERYGGTSSFWEFVMIQFIRRRSGTNFMYLVGNPYVIEELDSSKKSRITLWSSGRPIDYIDCHQGDERCTSSYYEMIQFSSITVREALYHIDDNNGSIESWGLKEWNSYVYKGELSPDFTNRCDLVLKSQKEQ